MTPRVTIVVPCYNHERFVTACIESLVRQTYRAFRLVVIDDGSKDGSPAILTALAARHGFKLILRENRGLANTLNEALDHHVDTELVIMFASDDVCEPDRLERQVAFFEAHPELAMVYGDAWKIDEAGQRTGKMIGTPAHGHVFDDALMGRLSVPAPTTIWRKSALDAIDRFEPDVRSEDLWLLWSVTRRFPVAYLPGAVASYREHGTQTSRDAGLMVAQAQKIIEKFADAPIYAEARRRQELFWFFALAKDHKRDALRYVGGAARQPLSPLFVGGVLTWLGLGGLRAPYAAVRDWIRRS